MRVFILYPIFFSILEKRILRKEKREFFSFFFEDLGDDEKDLSIYFNQQLVIITRLREKIHSDTYMFLS